MKRILTSIVLICSSSLFCLAQAPGQVTSPVVPNSTSTGNAKTKYIQEQRYLSKNSFDGYSVVPNDSLQGFDEASMKADLFTKGVYGSEYINFIALQKRAYIKQKYNLNPAPAP